MLHPNGPGESADDGAADDGGPGVARLENGELGVAPLRDFGENVWGGAEAADEEDCRDMGLGCVEDGEELGRDEGEDLGGERGKEVVDLAAGEN